MLGLAGFLDKGHIPLVLQLLFLILFTGLLVAIIIQGQDHLKVGVPLGDLSAQMSKSKKWRS
jgi:hypothetical protein